MKKLLLFTITLLFFNQTTTQAQKRNPELIQIQTANTELLLLADENGKLQIKHYGAKLNQSGQMLYVNQRKKDKDRKFFEEAYPAFGNGNINLHALTVNHADGSWATDLKYAGHSVNKGKHSTQTTITLRDEIYPVEVKVHYKAYPEDDIIEQWAEITNNGKKEVNLAQAASSFLTLKSDRFFLTHFKGAHANEMQWVEEPLTSGTKNILTIKGLRTSQAESTCFLVSLENKAQEESGEVYGGALAWSGNFQLSFQIDERDYLNIRTGINPYVSNIRLQKKQSFTTPKMLWSYSCSGKGQISRNFHRWARKHALRAGNEERPVVLNSWEGAYFDFSEKTLTDMMDDASKFGVEMFVLDDGWFGNKYPRNNDDAGLGDWQANQSKLPRGLNHLIDHAESKGLKFGLWVEPEMVNPQSELAEKHPEWIVQRPGRKPLLLRHQLTLDLTNPKVQDFVFQSVDELLSKHPRIAYVKWDANRHIENFGSKHLSKNKQSHFWTEYIRGLYKVYEKLMHKHPKVIMQVCSSGGGRVDYGSLPYHHEFWASDNTDALQRLYIQYGTGHFFPAQAMGTHVSIVPNHQTERIIPLKFRFDVAMTGRLGVELQPKLMPKNEREFAVNAIATYKKIRPIVQFGDLYRLNSPYGSDGWASQAFVSPGKNRALLFAYSVKHHSAGIFPRIKLKGLDAKKLTAWLNSTQKKSRWHR